MSEKKCPSRGRDIPWGYIFTLRHDRHDPSLDICQKCRTKRSSERREKERTSARGKG